MTKNQATKTATGIQKLSSPFHARMPVLKNGMAHAGTSSSPTQRFT